MNRVIKLRSVSISPSVEQERDAVFSNLRSRAWFRKDGERRGWGSNTNIRYVGIIQRTTQVTKKGHRSVFTLSSVVVSTTYRHCTPYWERRAYILPETQQVVGLQQTSNYYDWGPRKLR